MTWPSLTLLHRALSLLFGAPEEINGANRCPTYMYRWTLLKLGHGRSVYIHRFVGDDWSRDLHDHPKRFVSIGLAGRYIEHQPGGRQRLYVAPWFRSFPAVHVHRVTLPAGDCWTLVFVGRSVRDWGFWHKEGPGGAWRYRWIKFAEYVAKDNPLADQRKACS